MKPRPMTKRPDEPSQRPLEQPAVYCPGCGIELEFCVGWYDENDYEGMRCPEGCNLEDYYD